MKTIHQARKRFLAIFLSGFVFLFLILLGQTFADEYEDATIYVWLWFLFLYIPQVLLLFRVRADNRKINIFGLSILSVLLVISTCLIILLRPFMELSTIKVLTRSIFFLVPLEVLLMVLLKKIMMPRDDDQHSPDPKVFISYNHNDKAIAIKIKKAIEAAKIEVVIDSKNMKAGEDINTFIRKSLKASTIIVSLVSNSSLESAWVGMETIDTVFLETYTDNKKLIACYLEDDFFQDDYTLKTVTKIEVRIKELEELIRQSHVKGINTRDLDNKLTRLRNLKNNMDAIIARLQNSLCLDISPGAFETSMKKLLDTIQTDIH